MEILSKTFKRCDYYIKWRIGFACNYDCEYCIQGGKKWRDKRIKADFDILETAKKIVKLIKPGTSICIVGGEISVFKEIPEIIKMFRDAGAFQISCITNLSQPWEFYKDFQMLLASFHPSQIKDIDDFKEKLLKLKDAGVSVSTEVVLSTKSSEENNRKKEEYWKWCEENGIKITVDHDINDNNKNYRPVISAGRFFVDQKEVSKKDLLKTGLLNNTVGKICYFGVNSAYIQEDRFMLCGNEKFNRIFKWNEFPIICPQNNCKLLNCIPAKILEAEDLRKNTEFQE